VRTSGYCGLTVAALLIGSLAAAQPAASGTRAAQVVARVNGSPITDHDVESLAARMLRAQGSNPPAGAAETIPREALQALIEMELLTQEAKAEKIEAPESDVDQQVKDVKAHFASPDAYEKALVENHATEADMRRELARSILMQKLLDKRAPVKVPADAVERYYKDNQEQFQHPAEVRASHILFRAPKDSDGSTAKKKAEDTLARLQKGEDFAKLATELSEDPGSAENGGDLGFFAREAMVKPFADAAFALTVGQLSDVVQTDFGFHIIKVTETRPAGVAPLPEVHERLEQFLQEQERDKQEHAYVEELKKKAKIEIVDEKK
jgi:peptidyl-prolyl cis-trans isomerase C